MTRYPHGVGLIVGRTSAMPQPIASTLRGSLTLPSPERMDRAVWRGLQAAAVAVLVLIATGVIHL